MKYGRGKIPLKDRDQVCRMLVASANNLPLWQSEPDRGLLEFYWKLHELNEPNAFFSIVI